MTAFFRVTAPIFPTLMIPTLLGFSGILGCSASPEESTDETQSKDALEARYPGSPEGTEVDTQEFIDQVLLKTRGPLAGIANTLGYAWAGGCTADDNYWVRTADGNGWQSIRPPDGENCGHGYRDNERLRIDYKDLNFRLDAFQPGTPIVTNTPNIPFKRDIILDNANGPIDTKLETATRVDHTKSESLQHNWKVSSSVGIQNKWNVGIPGIGGFESSVTLSFGGEYGQQDGVTTTETVSDTVTVGATIPACTRVTYAIYSTRSDATVPFNAIFSLTFGVNLHGFLRWRDGDGNWHADYRGSDSRPTVDLGFGVPERPHFIEDLQYKMANNVRPWLWSDLLSQASGADYLRWATSYLGQKSLYQKRMTGVVRNVDYGTLHAKVTNVYRNPHCRPMTSAANARGSLEATITTKRP